MIEVKLTNEEMLQAVITGSRRLLVSANKSLDTGCARNWSSEIEGAAAEIAVAKATGSYFDPSVGKYKAKDVGEFHVRHTTLERGSLVIRDQDPDGKYLLVVGELGAYRIVGSTDSQRVKRPEYRKAPNGRAEAWFVPQTELEEM